MRLCRTSRLAAEAEALRSVLDAGEAEVARLEQRAQAAEHECIRLQAALAHANNRLASRQQEAEGERAAAQKLGLIHERIGAWAKDDADPGGQCVVDITRILNPGAPVLRMLDRIASGGAA